MIEIDSKAFVAALNEVAATDSGKIILACLKDYCRYNGDLVVENSPENTYANATLRRAYLYFRNHIKTEYLKKIEFDYIRKVDTNGNADSRTTKPARTISSRK